jgi:acetylornithine deacetylase/succinyl-diaminopimelate desuccinylase-like protein
MKLAERIKQTRKEIVEKTWDLVSIPTSVPPGENYEEAASWLRNFLEECGARGQLMNAPLISAER